MSCCWERPLEQPTSRRDSNSPDVAVERAVAKMLFNVFSRFGRLSMLLRAALEWTLKERRHDPDLM
jgi:hypothetical protein